LPHQPTTTCAEGQPKSNLALASGTSGKQKVRQISARYQQQDSDCR
jgi:hypothetical protein